MRCTPPLALVMALLAPSAGAEVMVRGGSDAVDVEASAAPLSEVLDRMARLTGMEIVYEGTPPSQRITLAIEGRTPSDAVIAILEGQGLNYALVADPSGARVQTLIIAGPAGKGTSSGGSSRARSGPRARRPIRSPPAAGPEMVDPEYDELEEEDPFEAEDPALLGDELPEEPPEAAEEGEVEPAEAPIPAAGPLPFPGGRQVFPASPFTPQPSYPEVPAPLPPGTGPDQGATPPASTPP
jgi:hypothetical protein